MKNQTHYLQAKETADNFHFAYSLAYAKDHLLEAYRKYKSPKINKMIRELATLIEKKSVRKCKICGDSLRIEDDLICGYHNLEP